MDTLMKPKEEIAILLGKRIYQLGEYRKSPVFTESTLREVQSKVSNWTKYTSDLLKTLFAGGEILDEFNNAGYSRIAYSFETGIHDYIDDLNLDMEGKKMCLESIVERLELFESLSINHKNTKTNNIKDTNKVFIVHGHDKAVLHEVARFIQKVDLKEIILHEQANRGLTVIEKFEQHSDVGAAIILLTPDDIGASKDDINNLKSRARQNVILELGYFLARLGRDRVIVLYKDEVELPSDYNGVLYVEFDNSNGWQMKLAQELKHIGMECDMNKMWQI